MAAKDEVGRHGENVAARTVQEWGWTVVARNWRCAQGELDLIALDGTELVIAEVKTRRSAAFGGAIEAVTAAKVARVRRLAAAWLACQERRYESVRIDVIAVTLPPAGAATVVHLRGVS